MVLGDTQSIPCNTAITQKFNHKFKCGKRSSEYHVKCQQQEPAQDNINSNNAMEFVGSILSQKCFAGVCGAEYKFYLFWKTKNECCHLCRRNKKMRQQTNTTSEAKQTLGHYSTAPHGNTAPQDTAHGSRVP